MAEVVVERVVDAPVADVWASWDDFANIAIFNPLINKSYLTGDSSHTGLGATRQCDFEDGKNHVKERIVGYQPEKQIVVEIYSGSVPIRDAVATIDFQPLSGDRTRVTMGFRFKPKMGLLGQAMLPIMRRQFAKNLGQLLEGNAAHVGRGALAAAA